MIGIALAAAATGVISGMAIGGGSLLVPALVFMFGLAQHTAQGVVLLSFLPVALVAASTHYRQGYVRPGLVLRLALPAVVGAVVGANVAAAVPAELLRQLFGGYLLIMAVYTFFTPGPGSARDENKHKQAGD